MKGIVEEGYDKIASDYNAGRLSRLETVSAYFDALSHYFPADGTMLDLGCGGGEPVTGYFARRGFDITGVDISSKMIDIARQQLPQGRFIQSDMTQCQFGDASFDLIVSTFAIIHIPHAEQAPLLSNIFKWLKPSGIAYLVLGAKHEESLVRDWKGVKMFWSHFSPKEYQSMFLRTGFQLLWEELEVLPNGERFYNVILRKP